MRPDTIRAGVIGWPISHSLSPRLHGYWLREHGIDGTYEAIAVEPGTLETRLREMAEEGFAGLNATIPHKEALLAAADVADDNASRIGAANTAVFNDGRIEVSNTDGFGFIENLRQSAPDHDFRRPALVIGAGGAARAIVVSLLDAGATAVLIANRTAERAAEVARTFEGVEAVPWEQRAGACRDAGLVVNTTSLGMAGNPPLDLALGDLPPNALVTDIVYNPLETPLLSAAKARGNPTVDGLGMLLHQARPGFEAWFGVLPDVTDELRAHVLAELAT